MGYFSMTAKSSMIALRGVVCSIPVVKGAQSMRTNRSTFNPCTSHVAGLHVLNVLQPSTSFLHITSHFVYGLCVTSGLER